jgi:hypothetical protein
MNSVLRIYVFLDVSGSLFFEVLQVHLNKSWSPTEAVCRRGVAVCAYSMQHILHWLLLLYCLLLEGEGTMIL